MAVPMDDRTLAVMFSNGTKGFADFTGQMTGILEPLSDPMVFAQAKVAAGGISWGGDADVDAEFVYALAHSLAPPKTLDDVDQNHRDVLMPNIIKLMMGDWSGDGHKGTYDFYIKTNFSRNEVVEAFERGVTKIDFNITEFCSEFEDNSLTKEQFEHLVDCGFPEYGCWYYKWFKNEGRLDEIDWVALSQEEFAEIYCFTVRQGNPEFRYVRLEHNSIDIGGYGLFL
jgi:hypothetical protein